MMVLFSAAGAGVLEGVIVGVCVTVGVMVRVGVMVGVCVTVGVLEGKGVTVGVGCGNPAPMAPPPSLNARELMEAKLKAAELRDLSKS